MLMAFGTEFGTLKSETSFHHHPNWTIFGYKLGTLISVWKCNSDEILNRTIPSGKRLSALELIINLIKSY
jgi:hypothetical protein